MIIAGRLWAALTVITGVVAVLLQLVLVIIGGGAVSEESPAPLGIRLWRLVSYFTIQSNLLVIVTVASLIRKPTHDGPRWRVLRLDGLIMIMVTGLVHWFLLRPLSTLSGWSALADTLLHILVPVLAVLGWLVFGPRPRITPATVAWSLVWPVAWLVYTVVVGAVTGWYPYPFLDPAESSMGTSPSPAGRWRCCSPASRGPAGGSTRCCARVDPSEL